MHQSFDVAIPALMKGNWPELKDLSIGSVVSDGLEYLANLPWSTLQRLQLNFGTVSPSGMYCLIHAHLPQLQELCFLNSEWYTEDEDCFAVLAQAKWPLLSKLELIGVQASHEGIRHLGTGQWPMLRTFTFTPCDVTDEHMQLLVQAAWPSIQNLTLVGHFEEMETLNICMRKWPALQTLELGVGSDLTHNATMSTMARARWPSLDLQLIPEI